MPTITLDQARQYAVAAGFSDTDIILAIAQAESGLDTTARNTNTDGSVDRGILQINTKYHPEYSDAQCDDPAEAFKAGYTIAAQGTNYHPWSTWGNGAYGKYMPSISRMCPNAIHFKEFYGGYHGTCGETALSTAMTCSTPHATEQDAINLMLSMTKEMIGLGWASSNGSSNMGNLRSEALRRGYKVDESSYVFYSEPLNPDILHALLLQTAGKKPIVIEIARAYALPGDEPGVDYHFICVVGISPSGYVVNDGDNSAIESHLITYPWAAIEAARPCAVMVLELQGAPTVSGVPAGWKDDGSILTAPNGETAQHAFRTHILAAANWPPMLMPVGEDYATAGGDKHDFTLSLEWQSASGQTTEVEGPKSLTSAPVDRVPFEVVVSDLQAAISKLP